MTVIKFDLGKRRGIAANRLGLRPTINGNVAARAACL